MERLGSRLLLLIPALLILSHWQKKDEIPTPPKAAQAHRSSDCCQLASATGLRVAMGRVMVHYPAAVISLDARIHLYKEADSKSPGGQIPEAFEPIRKKY